MNIENLDVRVEEILRKQEEINQDIERLNNLIKNKQKENKTSTVWEPGENEHYYFVEAEGKVTQFYNDSTIDEKIIKHTRVFKTKEEAEFEVERMRVLRELEKFACEFKYEFELPKSNRYIYYDYISNELSIGHAACGSHDLYFESKEKAKEAIEAVGEERVKKYYLGVIELGVN